MNIISNAYDVVLVPEKHLVERAIRTSHDLKRFGTHFTLDNKTYFPHVSIYMLQLKNSDLDTVFNLLEGIASNMPMISGTAKLYGTHNNYLDVEYEKTPEIQTLQNKVIGALNPIRDGLRERDKERLLTATGAEKGTILKYGYRSVGEYFEPHMTFTRFLEPQGDMAKSLPDLKIFNGNFPKLGIYEMGDNGTCVKEVKTWQLR